VLAYEELGLDVEWNDVLRYPAVLDNSKDGNYWHEGVNRAQSIFVSGIS